MNQIALISLTALVVILAFVALRLYQNLRVLPARLLDIFR